MTHQTQLPCCTSTGSAGSRTTSARGSARSSRVRMQRTPAAKLIKRMRGPASGQASAGSTFSGEKLAAQQGGGQRRRKSSRLAACSGAGRRARQGQRLCRDVCSLRGRYGRHPARQPHQQHRPTQPGCRHSRWPCRHSSPQDCLLSAGRRLGPPSRPQRYHQGDQVDS